MVNKPRILYISSASPIKGPGAIGGRHVKELKKAGYDVDMLTLYKEICLPEVMYVKKHDSYIDRFRKGINYKLKRLIGAPHYFFYREETKPPVRVSKVLSRVRGSYDLVIVYFWQEMLSFKTIEAISDKLNHPLFFFLCPDYSHMSGGCHFPCDCIRYRDKCGYCPAFNSNIENDFTRKNVVYRKRVYDTIRPVVFGNKYMARFYENSYLLKNARIEVYPPSFDIETFRPMDKMEARAKMRIPKQRSFVISFGCQELNDPRKGITYLIDALTLFKTWLTKEERDQIQLIVAGKEFDKINKKLPFDSISAGWLSVDQLSSFYSASSIFVCPSVDDAGPSMVSQSISCGIPVVGFEMGALLDSVKNQGTGYCAELKNTKDLAIGIEYFFRMSRSEYEIASNRCRQFAIEHSGFNKTIESWMEIYEKYKQE